MTYPTGIVAARGVAGLGSREKLKRQIAERLMFERQFLGECELEIDNDVPLVRQLLAEIIDDAPKYKIDPATAARVRAALERK